MTRIATRILNLPVKHYCSTCFPADVGEVRHAYKRLPDGKRSGECTFCRRATKHRVVQLRALTLGAAGEGVGLPDEVYESFCRVCGENFHKGELLTHTRDFELRHLTCL